MKTDMGSGVGEKGSTIGFCTGDGETLVKQTVFLTGVVSRLLGFAKQLGSCFATPGPVWLCAVDETAWMSEL